MIGRQLLISFTLLGSGLARTLTLKKGEYIPPEDVGEIHNRILLQVKDRFAEAKPENRHEAFIYIKEEMMNLCEDGDLECEIEAEREAINFEFKQSLHLDVKDVLPYRLNDQKLVDALEGIYSSISLLETQSPEDTIETMQNIAEKYLEEEQNEAKRDVVTGTASVAVASTQLWADVASNPDDAFHEILKTGGVDRRLQFNLTATLEDFFTSIGVSDANVDKLIAVIEAGVIAAITGFLFPAIISILFGIGVALTPIATLQIVLASFQAFLDF